MPDIKVHCTKKNVHFEIPWKRVKNTMNLCYYCPLYHHCHGKYKFKIFDVIRENMKAPVEVII